MDKITSAYISLLNERNTITPSVVEDTPQIVTETTVPEHLRARVDDWDHHWRVDTDTKAKMRNALNGNTFTTFPLEDHSLPDPDVHDHLHEHGYKIESYKDGTASKTVQVGAPDRGIPLRDKKVVKKIGKVLDETSAPDHVKHAYMNDPARASSTQNNLHVLISTTPLAIAGMTTGTAWHDHSCMEMEHGLFADKLSHDSALGTHVAYLVHGTDKGAMEHGEPDNPIARILLKAHHAKIDGKKDTIFRPEAKQYGSESSAFGNAVHKWAREKYPAHTDVEYEKNEHLYDDDSRTVHKELGDAAAHDYLSGSRFKEDNMSLTRPQIEKAIANPGQYMQRRVLKITNLTSHDIKRLGSHPDYDPDTLQHFHGDKFTPHMIEELVKHAPSVNVALSRKTLSNPRLPDNIVDMLSPGKYDLIRRSKLKERHLDKAIDGNSWVGMDATKHLAKERHLRDLMKQKALGPMDVTSHPSFTKAVHDSIVADHPQGDEYRKTQNILASSKFATLNDIKDKYDVAAMAHNKNIDHSSPALKELYMTHVKEDPGTELKDVFGRIYGSSNNIPKNISQHFTTKDYDTLMDRKLHDGFASAEHAKNYVKYALDKAEQSSNMSLTDHIIRNMHDIHENHDNDKVSKDFLVTHIPRVLALAKANRIDKNADRKLSSLNQYHAYYG